MGDWPLHVLNARHGLIGFLDESMAAHRMHAGGIWTSRKQFELDVESVEAWRYFRACLDRCHRKVVNERIAEHCYACMLKAFGSREYRQAGYWVGRNVQAFFPGSAWYWRQARHLAKQALKKGFRNGLFAAHNRNKSATGSSDPDTVTSKGGRH